MRKYIGKQANGLTIGDIAAGGLAILVAFGWAGYVGIPASDVSAPAISANPWNVFITEPWTLYALIVFFMVAAVWRTTGNGFLSSAIGGMRGRVTTVAVTLLCALVVGVVHLAHLARNLPGFIQQVLTAIDNATQWLARNPRWTITLLAFGILTLYIVLALLARRIPDIVEVPQDKAAIPLERTAGDLLIGIAVCWFTLLVVLAAAAWFAIVPDQGRATPLICDITPAWAACDAHMSIWSLNTFLFIDAIFLPLVLVMVVAGIVGAYAMLEVLNHNRPEGFFAVWRTTMKDVVGRRVHPTNIVLSLRGIWPLFLLVATACAGEAASAIGQLLFNLRQQQGGNNLFRDLVILVDVNAWNYVLRIATIVAVMVIVAMTMCAVMLQVAPRRARKLATWRVTVERLGIIAWSDIRFYGLVIVQAYALTSFILWGTNVVAEVLHAWLPQVVPQAPSVFAQPDPVWLASLIILVLHSWLVRKRNAGERNAGKPVEDDAPAA